MKNLQFDRPNYFATSTKERGTEIRGTVCFGTAKPTQDLIESCQTDMIMEPTLQFHLKDLQTWSTSHVIALACCNNEIPSTTMTEMTGTLFRESELIFMKRYPDRFPSGIFGGPIPLPVVKNGWARGTPWIDPKTRSKDDTSYWKVMQITMDKKDEERMTTVFREIKKKGCGKDLFEEHFYIASQPINEENHEKEVWASKSRHHKTVMRNTGEATFPGLEFPDAATKMERFEVATDGSEVSIITSLTTSVRKLIYKFKARDGN